MKEALHCIFTLSNVFLPTFQIKKGQAQVVIATILTMEPIIAEAEVEGILRSIKQNTQLSHIRHNPSSPQGVTNSHSGSDFSDMTSHSETVDDISTDLDCIHQLSIQPFKTVYKRNMNSELVRSLPYGRNQQVPVSSSPLTRVSLKYQCEHCMHRYASKRQLLKHRMYYHRIARCECFLCQRQWDIKRDVRKHSKNSHADALKCRLSCGLTQSSFPRDHCSIDRSSNACISNRTLHSGEVTSTVDSHSRQVHSYPPYYPIRSQYEFRLPIVAYNETTSVSNLLSRKLTGLRIDTPGQQPNTNNNTAATNANTTAMAGSDELSLNLNSLHICTPALSSHSSRSHAVTPSILLSHKTTETQCSVNGAVPTGELIPSYEQYIF